MGLASFLSARLVAVEPPETMFIKAGGIHCFSKTRACRGSASLSFRLSRISNCLPYYLTISGVRLVHSEAQELISMERVGEECSLDRNTEAVVFERPVQVCETNLLEAREPSY